MEELPSTGRAYALDLLGAWNKVRALSDEVRSLFLQHRMDPRLMSDYVATMTTLWLELYPKITGRSEFGDLPERFEAFADAYYAPQLLFTNPERALELQRVIREAMEKLKITEFEGGI